MRKIIVFLLLAFSCNVYAADLTDQTEDTAPTSDDLMYTVNNPAVTPADRKVTLGNAAKAMTSTNLTDTADILYETELDTFSELDAQVADQTLVHSNSNIATATALAANPADCAANTFATTIAASGALTCATVIQNQIGDATGSSTINMDGYDLNYIFDDPSGSFNITAQGAYTAHGVLTVKQQTGNPGVSHLVHAEANDLDVSLLHLLHNQDSASFLQTIIESDSATPSANDEMYHSWKFSDSLGNQDEFFRLSVINADPTATSEDGGLTWDLIQGGVLTEIVALNSLGNLQIDGDLTISGDDLFMATNTNRFVLMGDGTNYNPEAIDLGTDTTGGYATSTTEGGGATGLEADGVDALTEIAQGIKTAANDTSPLVIGTAGSNGEIAKWNTDGTLTDGNVIFGTMTDGKWCSYASTGTLLSCIQDAPAGSGDITDVFSCASGDCASITMAATDLLDMSGTDASTATEGLILPQHATACAGGTAEGQVCWEADANILHIGDGATIVDFVPTTAFSGDATVSTTGAVTVADDQHAHTTTTISGVDISADTNLTAGDNLTLTDDDLDLDAAVTIVTSLASPILKSTNADPADAGIIRLGNAESIAWEAAPAGTDITLSVDASEIMQVSGALNAVGAITGSNLSGTNTGDNTVATSGDSATSFFATGTLEVAIGGTGTTTSTGTGAVVLGTSPTITTSINLPAGAIDAATEIAADLITHTQIADADQMDTKCIWFETPTAADDFKSIWFNGTANDFQVTEIWAESDQTVTFMLQLDDGTPADCDTVDLAPAAGTAEDTALDGDCLVSAGERLDLATTSVANTPTFVSICWTGNWVD